MALILMGNPLHMSGREGRQTEYAREFGARLQAATGLPVEFRDERLTTVEAERVLRQSGISIEKRAKAVDRLAAVILLESYLDSQPVYDAPPLLRRMLDPVDFSSDFRRRHRRRCCYSFDLRARIKGFAQPVILDFPKGTSTRAMAAELREPALSAIPGNFWWRGRCGRRRACRPANISSRSRFGADGVRSHRSRRRLLLRAHGPRRQQHVRYRGQCRPVRFHEGLGFPARRSRSRRRFTISLRTPQRSKVTSSRPLTASSAAPP